MSEDRLGTGPMAGGWAVQTTWTGRMVSALAGHGNHLSTPLKYVETPCRRSKLSHLSSGQLSPPLDLSLLPDHILAPSLLPQRPYKGLNSILSHSHTIPLSLFYFRLPTHLPLAQFLAYPHSFPIGQLRPLDSYITSDPFALSTLLALMKEAACTSETSVDIQLRTWQYIQEDSELQLYSKSDTVHILSFSRSVKV
jgi:hypothetical protein